MQPAWPLSDNSSHVGDQDVSAQIVQPSDALGATDPLAQRTLPRSASKHPDCRTVARARGQASTTPTTSLPSSNATSRHLVAGETAGSSPKEGVVPPGVEIHSDGRSELNGYIVSAAIFSSTDV